MPGSMPLRLPITVYTRVDTFLRYFPPHGRQGLQGELLDRENGIPAVSFAVSPTASLDDLCTTHDRGYVERYFEGRFTNVRTE